MLDAEGEQLACGQSLVARVNRVRLHIVCLHHLGFWDGSKVSGTKRRNKTAGAYSGIPGDDMRARLLKANINVRTGFIGGQPLAGGLRGRVSRKPGFA
ncbi:conserved protein of unknown function [Paraburkholderia dioscoreae]|uniref:Uncharacterized protein n=1 Tax=Paraburkholderia dioscoreae TaxID=2604047 RepID=A0A5Q4YUA1_9BURK|nr:conserved protein of unknown function [Paraburkholderia dioscoreae]